MDKSRKRPKYNPSDDEMVINNKRKHNNSLPSSSLLSSNNLPPIILTPPPSSELNSTLDVGNEISKLSNEIKTLSLSNVDESINTSIIDNKNVLLSSTIEKDNNTLSVNSSDLNVLKSPLMEATRDEIRDNNNQVIKKYDLYDKLDQISEMPLNEAEKKQINKCGLWWNYFAADIQNVYYVLKPEDILINYIFQSKYCCSFYNNDDLFNYLSLDSLFSYIITGKGNSKSDEDVNEVDYGDILLKFSNTTETDLLYRAILIAKETQLLYHKPEFHNLDEMIKYEKFNYNTKIVLSGELNDWYEIKVLLNKLKMRCENVIESILPDQASRLININKKVELVVDNIIEHKMNIVNGKFWDNVMLYHFDTFQFSGVMCNFAITTLFKYSRAVNINTILSECAKLTMPPQTLVKEPHYTLITTTRQNILRSENQKPIITLENKLSLFKASVEDNLNVKT